MTDTDTDAEQAKLEVLTAKLDDEIRKAELLRKSSEKFHGLQPVIYLGSEELYSLSVQRGQITYDLREHQYNFKFNGYDCFAVRDLNHVAVYLR